MLSGRFENCYGMKEFNMPNIQFGECNKALIYAPNGVMKSSLAQTFDDIAKGQITRDRIFPHARSKYSLTHYTTNHIFDSDRQTAPAGTDKIYVVKTFSDKFEFTKETVGTLLADETTRHEYNLLVEDFSDDIKEIEKKLSKLSGLSKAQIKNQLISDFNLVAFNEWIDIFEEINPLFETFQDDDIYNCFKYKDLFNEKVLPIYSDPDFMTSIENYVDTLNGLLDNNPLLNQRFNDKNAETLSKSLKDNNLFEADHTIHLNNEQGIIHSIEEWNIVVEEQLKIVYSDDELSETFSALKKKLTANVDATKLRSIIISHREIIPFFRDIESFKKNAWLHCFANLDHPFNEYYEKFTRHAERIRELYERADEQSQRWQQVVSEFNTRFRVPFEVKIENKANFLLKDEAPNLSFVYSRGNDDTRESANVRKDDLMISLSTGEKRALYLLYILFDLEKIRKQASEGAGQFLIVADDIADSFDYKNKYAIIEYLNDLSSVNGIDLLILTHNFDFYRTVKSRLGIVRQNCYISQKDENGKVYMKEFRYQNDFFKNVVVRGIHDGNIVDDEKKKLLISSIPFYRNLCEYNGDEDKYKELTCCLHWKTNPIDTSSYMLSDLWNTIKGFLNNQTFAGQDEKYIDAVDRIANDCVAAIVDDEVSLEINLVIAIDIRLRAERFLKSIIINNTGGCEDSTSNQMRQWYSVAMPYLNDNQKKVLEEVNLITPESIHINSFMYEPLIDVSNWTLKRLYNDVCGLNEV